MTGLFIAICTFGGAFVVGCCWAIYNIAFNAGVRAGRDYEKVMRERYEQGRLDASLPSYNYPNATPSAVKSENEPDVE